MHLLVLRGNELLFLRLLVPELSHHGLDLDSLLVRLLYLPHLGRCVAYSAMVNAPNPDGASVSTVPHVTTPALLALTVVLLMGVLADAFRPSILLRAAIPPRTVPHDSPTAGTPHLVCSRHGTQLSWSINEYCAECDRIASQLTADC